MTSQPNIQTADKEDTVEIYRSAANEAINALVSLETSLSQKIVRLTSSFLKVKEPHVYDDLKVFCWDTFVPAVAELNEVRELRKLISVCIEDAKCGGITLHKETIFAVWASLERLEQLLQCTALRAGKHIVDSLESDSCNSYEAPVRELYEAVMSFEKYRDLRRRFQNSEIDDLPPTPSRRR